MDRIEDGPQVTQMGFTFAIFQHSEPRFIHLQVKAGENDLLVGLV